MCLASYMPPRGREEGGVNKRNKGRVLGVNEEGESEGGSKGRAIKKG